MSSVFAVLVGFLLPWQTRYLLRVPLLGGLTWDFGIVSVYVSQAVLAVWLLYEAWFFRADLRAWVRTVLKRRHTRLAAILALTLIAVQIIFSADRLLTLMGAAEIAELAAFLALLSKRPKLRSSVLVGFLVSAVMQAILAFMQVWIGSSFASTVLGIAAHHAADHGATVFEYAGRRYLRAYGGQTHPNIFGALMLVALYAYAQLLSVQREIAKRSNVIQFVILITAALFFSFSRSAWGVFALVLAYAWTKRTTLSETNKLILKWALGTFVVLMIIFAPIVKSRFVAQTYIEQRSLTERVTDLGRWRQVAKQHWFVGTGFHAYSAALPPDSGDRQVPMHSVPLLVFAEFGVLGLQLMWAVLWLAGVPVGIVTPFIFLLPIALFDHYLVSLWGGMVLIVVGAIAYTTRKA